MSDCKLTLTLDLATVRGWGGARAGLVDFDLVTHPMWGSGIALVDGVVMSGFGRVRSAFRGVSKLQHIPDDTGKTWGHYNITERLSTIQ